MSALEQITIGRRRLGVIVHDEKRSAGGIVLFSPQTGAEAILIELNGTVIHRWALPSRPGRHAVLLANGNLGFNGMHPRRADYYPAWDIWHGGLFTELRPDGEVVWQHEDHLHHHDGLWLDNGHLLYTIAEPIPSEVAAKIVGGSSTDFTSIVGDVIKEVSRDGRVVWQWRSWEHLAPSDFPIHPVFDRSHWPLINGLSVTRDGHVLASLRTTSGIIAINRETKKISWKIGHDILAQQHSPSQLANGNILAFDNGNFRLGATVPASRIVEIEPKSSKVVWEYADPMRPSFFSPYMGSAQQLANGNVHVTESAMGRLFEVTRSGEIVWEYVIPQFNQYPAGNARIYASGYHNSAFQTFRYRRGDIPWL